MSMLKIKKITHSNIDLSNVIDGAEVANYSSFEADKGYGNIASVGVKVQKGVTVKANVRIEMDVVTVESLRSVFNKHKTSLNDKYVHEIEHNLNENNACSGLWGIFSGLRSHHDKSEWERETNIKETVTDVVDQSILKDIYNMVSTKALVEGEISIVGMSFIPTEAVIYAKACTIEFNGNRTIQVIDSSPVACSKDGDTSKVQVEPGSKLKIKPLK